MAERAIKKKKPVFIKAARPLGEGDVFTDRLYLEWPSLYGWEIGEEEYKSALSK